MNQIAAQFRIHSSELKQGFIIFWTILLAIIIGFYLISAIFDAQNMFVFTNIPIYVFMAITSFRLIKEDFRYSIHLGLTRNRFVLGCLVYIFAIVLLFNLLNQLLLFISTNVQGNLIDQALSIFTWSSLLQFDFGFWGNLGLDILLTSFFSFFLYFLASLLFRFGQLAVYLVLLVTILVLLIPTVNEGLLSMGSALYMGNDLSLVWYMIAITVLFPVLSMFTLSKASA